MNGMEFGTWDTPRDCLYVRAAWQRWTVFVFIGDDCQQRSSWQMCDPFGVSYCIGSRKLRFFFYRIREGVDIRCTVSRSKCNFCQWQHNELYIYIYAYSWLPVSSGTVSKYIHITDFIVLLVSDPFVFFSLIISFISSHLARWITSEKLLSKSSRRFDWHSITFGHITRCSRVCFRVRSFECIWDVLQTTIPDSLENIQLANQMLCDNFSFQILFLSSVDKVIRHTNAHPHII